MYVIDAYRYSFLSLDTCHFQKLAEESTAPTEFDFNWNSMPTVVGEIIKKFLTKVSYII